MVRFLRTTVLLFFMQSLIDGSKSSSICFDKLDTIVIGICGGDGIGPVITKESERVLAFLLKDEVASGKVQFKEIDATA